MPGQQSFIENKHPGFYTDKYGNYHVKRVHALAASCAVCLYICRHNHRWL